MAQSAANLLARLAPDFPRRHAGTLVTDTTDFTRIGHGDVIELSGRHYLVLRDEAERRFGLEDPKYWVKRCRELQTGERKILKLVFYETFPVHIGSMNVICHRSPEKEARILSLVAGDSRFMQGTTTADAAGNAVRILDVVAGRRLDEKIEDLEMPHEAYCFTLLPDILARFARACRAIGFLHSRGEKHGDIRRDHLYAGYDTGEYCWIDFDYTFDTQNNPFGLDLFGLGNILIFLVGMGSHIVSSACALPGVAGLVPEDCSIVFANRVANLQKLFPYIPDEINRILLRYSQGSEVFYETVDELLADLEPAIDRLKP